MSKKPTVEIEQIVPWSVARDAARRTIGKEPLGREKDNVSDKFKVQSCMAEHSHIKLVQYRLSFKDLKQWIGVHLLRHPYVLPFIHSQRPSRREDIDKLIEKVLTIISDDIKNDPDFNKRDYLFQGEVNDQDFYVNVQTLINISRKRLCTCASKETRDAWRLVKDAIQEIDPMVAHCMVRQCIYRGFCPEMYPACKYWRTDAFKKELEEYRKVAPAYEEMLNEKSNKNE